MFKSAYFVRRAKDESYKIYQCDLELNTNSVLVEIPKCNTPYFQNDGNFRDGGRFCINFNVNTIHSRLSLHNQALEVGGLLHIEKDEVAFFDAYVFYFNKESIIDDKNLEMGN